MGVLQKALLQKHAFIKVKANEKPIKHQQNRAFATLYKVQLLPKNKRVCSVLF